MNLGSSQKNVIMMNVNNMNLGSNLGGSLNMGKYRAPSPSSMSKTSTITIGSMKVNGVGKAKWK